DGAGAGPYRDWRGDACVAPTRRSRRFAVERDRARSLRRTEVSPGNGDRCTDGTGRDTQAGDVGRVTSAPSPAAVPAAATGDGQGENEENNGDGEVWNSDVATCCFHRGHPDPKSRSRFRGHSQGCLANRRPASIPR